MRSCLLRAADSVGALFLSEPQPSFGVTQGSIVAWPRPPRQHLSGIGCAALPSALTPWLISESGRTGVNPEGGDLPGTRSGSVSDAPKGRHGAGSCLDAVQGVGQALQRRCDLGPVAGAVVCRSQRRADRDVVQGCLDNIVELAHRHFGVTYRDALRLAACVKFAAHLQSSPGGGGSDHFNHRLSAGQRLGQNPQTLNSFSGHWGPAYSLAPTFPSQHPAQPLSLDVFVYIEEFPPFAVPDVEMRVEYETADDRGRVKAVNVRLVT